MGNHVNEDLCEAAATNNVAEVTRLLHDPAADPYFEDSQHKNAFNYAANHVESLAILAETALRDVQKPVENRRWQGQSLDAGIGKLHASLSSYIVKACAPPIVQEMLAAAPDLTVKDDDGWNLLHKLAVMPERSSVLKLLTEAMEEKGVLLSLLSEKTARSYDTTYGTVSVHYPDQQTPLDLYNIRSQHDPKWAAATEEYGRFLVPAGRRDGKPWVDVLGNTTDRPLGG